MFTSAWMLDKAGPVTLAGAPAGHDARVLAELAMRATGKVLVHVAIDDMRAAILAEAFAFFAPNIDVLSFPAWDCLPYDRISPQPDIISQRITTLARLRTGFKRPTLILTTVNAVAQKTLPPEVLQQASLNAALGDELPVEKLRAFLAGNGYAAAGTVREPGEFAVRGGIVDLFPPGYDAPVRLDFFGDEIESIRVFDPISQTTTDKIESLHLGPISEVILSEAAIAHFRSQYRALFGAVTDSDALYESVTAGRKFPGVEHWLGLFYPRLYSLFDYLPQAPVSFDHQAHEAITSRLQQIEDFYQARQALYQASKRAKRGENAATVYKPAPTALLYLGEAGLKDILQSRPIATLSPFAPTESASVIDVQGRRGPDFSEARAKGQEVDLYAAFKDYAAEQQAINKRVVLACYSQGSADRLSSLLKTHGIASLIAASSWDELRKCDPKLIGLVILGLEHGFVAPDLAFITEQDVLGDRMVRPVRKRRAAKQFQLELGDMNPGDFVVHDEHGIGRYEGLETITVFDTSHDCVKLVYDGGDKLFVPVENLDALTRYASAETGAHLDKLGGLGWQQRKARVKKRLKDMAEALMKIAAARELKKGEIIVAPPGSYEEFASRFPYPETEDQAKAIEDVLTDMASGRAMDRLVCGDVGFGKTEVALRAAFATVQSRLQVAVVVPTTLLARQHFNNFSNRF